MIPVFKGFVKDGKLVMLGRNNLRNYLHTLDGPVGITIKKYKKQRSGKQNRYYWGVVIRILSNEIGYTADEMHQALKFQFLRKPGEDSRLPTILTTKELSTAEFEDYLETVKRWAAVELSIFIPDPEGVDVF